MEAFKIVVGYDSNDPSMAPNVTLLDAAGEVVDVDVEVRDYGRGDEVDDAGNFYATVEG